MQAVEWTRKNLSYEWGVGTGWPLYFLISFSFHFLSQDFLPDKSFWFGFPTAQPKSDECQAYRQKKWTYRTHCQKLNWKSFLIIIIAQSNPSKRWAVPIIGSVCHFWALLRKVCNNKAAILYGARHPCMKQVVIRALYS